MPPGGRVSSTHYRPPAHRTPARPGVSPALGATSDRGACPVRAPVARAHAKRSGGLCEMPTDRNYPESHMHYPCVPHNLAQHEFVNSYDVKPSKEDAERMKSQTMQGVLSRLGARRKRRLRIAASALALPFFVAIGGCAHAQRPERRVYVISEDANGIGGSGGRNCDAEHIQCFDRCWNAVPPLTSIKRGSGKHHEYCTEECRKEYMDCLKEQQAPRSEEKALQFSSIGRALEWLKEHKTEVAIGTVVVVAGVAFIVATGGTGALILAPLAL